VLVHPETDYPDRFAAGSELSTEAGRILVVERSQPSRDSFLVRFVGVTDRTGAEGLTGEFLFIDPAERRDLDPDEFWPDELLGLSARAENGDLLGEVVDVIEGPAQFRLVIQAPSGTFEVPFVAALVPQVDLEAGSLVLADIPGLIPES
jgi:16S rRNA processing protein RimM